MALLALLLFAGGPQKELSEYELKAGFLYNFAKYVDWPEDAFDNPSAPFVVGIVGRDPFGEALARALRGKQLEGRSFRIERFGTPADIGRCHVLFVPRAEAARTAEVLKAVEGKPVLTVGEDGAFPRAGGMVAVLVKNERAALEINREASERAGLVLDARLLRVATLVKGP